MKKKALFISLLVVGLLAMIVSFAAQAISIHNRGPIYIIGGADAPTLFFLLWLSGWPVCVFAAGLVLSIVGAIMLIISRKRSC